MFDAVATGSSYCRAPQIQRRESLDRRIRVLILQLSIALLALHTWAGETSAQVFYSWTNPNGGSYGTSVNWSPGFGAPPDGIDGAEFGIAATYTVDFFSDFAISDAFVSAGNVTWDLGQGSAFQHFYVADDVEVTTGGQLRFFDGTLVANTMLISSGGKVLVLGADRNDAAHITVTGAGSTLTHENFLEVANYRPETLTIQNGGTVITGSGSVGADPFLDSEGIVTVTGAGSSWTVNNSNLDVGDFSRGTLNITSGGAVTSRFGNIGFSGQGTVNISGANSKWTNTQDLYVSRDKDGALNITAGGLASSVNGKIGSGTGADGVAHVTGVGSKWTNSGQLFIGDTSETTGLLTIEAGAAVTNTNGIIGNEGVFSDFPAAVGTVDVTGAGSTWTNNGTLSVGRSGVGSLNIKNGGAVADTFSYIAYETGSEGKVTVTGNESTWTNSGSLEVGRQGTGLLTITDHGNVTNTIGLVGGTNQAQPGIGSGSVKVSGAGSTWTTAVNTHIGHTGTGTLTIENGGNVTDINGFLATFVGSVGTATVTGAGSTWTNTDSLNIGSLGTGTLTIENGGSVTNTDGHVGPSPGSLGNVVVRGASSTWNMTGDLFLGAQGTGSLTIENGGKVASLSGNIARAGGTPFGTASVTVTGAGSKWTNINELRVGNNGVGTLNVANGAAVTNSDAYIATTAGSKGTAIVGGSGANWTINGVLNVGGDLNTGIAGGTALLDINAGGTVNTHDTVIFQNGKVRLQGGTLDTTTVSFQVAGHFEWTSGTLHTTIFQGDLLNEGGKLAPGHSIGLTTVTGNYTQLAAGQMEFELGGPTGADNDFASVVGTASLAGQLQLALVNGYVPGANQVVQLLNAGALTGAFSNVANGQRIATTDNRGSFKVNYGLGSPFNPNQVVLSNFLATMLAGDYNQNGVVDAGDYVVWRMNSGTTNSLPNDSLGGTIGTAQYNQWRANFGKTLSQVTAPLVNIPEPCSAVLLAAGLLSYYTRRKRFNAASILKTRAAC
jgi:T5SS/PEP-CTERM-associated repeat protein